MYTVATRSHAVSLLLLALTLGGCGSGGGAPASQPDAGNGLPPGQTDAGDAAPATDAGPVGLPPNFDAGVPIVTAAIPLARCTNPVASDAAGVVGPVYTANVTLGSQTFAMAVDTGSSEMAVASSSCANCGAVSPLYAPGPTATDLMQPGSIGYSNTGLSGELYQETARIGGAPGASITLLAVEKNAGFFGSALCNTNQGIFGLALPVTAETDYFPTLVAKGSVPDIFAIGLCPTGGSLWLGGFDPSAVTGAPQFTPLLEGGYVELTGVAVGDTAVAVPASSLGPMNVDTGNPQLEIGAFPQVAAALGADAGFQKVFGGASWFSGRSCTSVTQSAAELDAMLPSLTLTFGSNPSISVRAPATSSYLQAQSGAGGVTWCPGMMESAAQTGGSSGEDAGSSYAPGSIGDSFLRSSVVIWDRQNQRMGFAPHTCE